MNNFSRLDKKKRLFFLRNELKLIKYKSIQNDLSLPKNVRNQAFLRIAQLTNLGKANWAPYFHPKGDKIIFSSNHAAPRGYQFNLYMINLDGTGLKQITFDKTFDSFPMFSYDGKKIIFASNRNNGGTRDTNLFIADWVD